jgi:hypothetical protein
MLGAAAVLAAPRSANTQGVTPMTHIVLLGDSVFDNAAYVAGPDVARQLRGLLPTGWRATLGAVGGAVIADVARQLHNLPADATHIVISAGGNDALGQTHLLEQRVSSMAEALELLSGVRERFRAAYAAMLEDVEAPYGDSRLHAIYEPRFPEPARRRLAATALAVLNDAITREAFARGVACIDLRVLCRDDRDFANPIEPSVHGGEKIARATLAFAGEDEGVSRVIAR